MVKSKGNEFGFVLVDWDLREKIFTRRECQMYEWNEDTFEKNNNKEIMLSMP